MTDEEPDDDLMEVISLALAGRVRRRCCIHGHGRGILPSLAPLASSTGIQIAYVVGLVLVLFLGPVTIAEMKGHDWFVGFGWLTFGVTWWIGAFKLARPESWWSRHLYGPRKMARGPKIATKKALHLNRHRLRRLDARRRLREAGQVDT